MDVKINNNLEMIVNVYSQNYNNAPGGGIGDFIRGSLFLIQYCIINNLKFDIDYKNHPISKYLYKKNDKIEERINYDEVSYYYQDNSPINNVNINDFLTEFTNHINSKCSKIIYLFSNNYPIYKITNLERSFIRDKFLPNAELSQYINNRLQNLNLNEKQFNIIHIRINDTIFKNDNIHNNLFKNIKYKLNNIIQILNKNNMKILLLSNSNILKLKLKMEFKHLIIYTNNIGHLALTNDDETIKDTLCDMFIISKAVNVVALSDYGHGTGFSKYVCELYNIPYKCILL
jgi:hypothetical protein